MVDAKDTPATWESTMDPMMITPRNKPDGLGRYRKTATIELQWVNVPFRVRTMEGTTHLIDAYTDGWEDGYWVAWPDDGTDPYLIAPSFVRDNYQRTHLGDDNAHQARR